MEKHAPQLIIGIIYIGIFGLAVYFVFGQVLNWTETQEDIALYLLGILSAGLVQVTGYFYNTSAGSKDKTALLTRKD